jgi:hypothetical protein
MSYSSYTKGNTIKWIGIIIILMIFLPIFNYKGAIEPIWAYLTHTNWETGLRIGQHYSSDLQFGISIAILQLLIGIFLILIGNSMAREFSLKLRY